MHNALQVIWNSLVNILQVVGNILWVIITSDIFKAWVKISLLLIITLGIGPIFYLGYDWPYDLKPRNYFEFLNTGLLLFLTYHVVLKMKIHLECWFKDDD